MFIYIVYYLHIAGSIGDVEYHFEAEGGGGLIERGVLILGSLRLYEMMLHATLRVCPVALVSRCVLRSG